MDEHDYYGDPERYDAEYGFYTVDMAWYLEQARRAGGPVLVLGCGTGRILFRLAAAGLDVDGLDRSPVMLDHARTRALSAGAEIASRIRLFEADLRSFELPRAYRVILAPLNCLMHLHRDDEVAACLARVRHHLLPEGRFLFDVANPREELLIAHGGPEGIPLRDIRFRGRAYLQRERHAYDAATRISETIYIFEPHDAEGTPFFARLRLRMFEPAEIDGLLQAADFRIEKKLGDFGDTAFDGTSLFQVVVAGATSAPPGR